MSEHAEKHFLDVDNFEVARSIHRIVRAMHDGECPKCHRLFPSPDMRNMVNSSAPLCCPLCHFTISAEEQRGAIELFGPIMERNLEVFEKWRLSQT